MRQPEGSLAGSCGKPQVKVKRGEEEMEACLAQYPDPGNALGPLSLCVFVF